MQQGTYLPAYELTGPGITDADGTTPYMDNSGKNWIPTDYEESKKQAQEALAAAGYPNGEGFPTITYTTNDSGYNKAVAEYMQQCYKEVLGINLEIEIVEWSSFTPLRRSGDYEMARNGWVFDYNDPSNILELFMTENGNNDGKYSNAKYDELMNNTNIADVEQRFANLHAAEELLMSEYAMIPIAHNSDFWLQSTDLQGVWHSPYGYWYLQYAYIGEPSEGTVAESESVADSTAAESTASEAASSEAAESVASEASSSEAASSEAAESAVSEAASSEAAESASTAA